GTTLILLCIAGVSVCPLVEGECEPAEPVAKALQVLPTQAAGPSLHRLQGLTYLDIQCFEEAQAAFQQELDVASNLPESQRENQLNLARILLDLTGAFVNWHNGKLNEAKETLLRLSDPGMPTFVNSRAIFSLAELLMQSPDSTTWALLEPKLRTLDEDR